MIVDSKFYELATHLWRAGSYAYYWLPEDEDGNKVTWWESLPTTKPVPKSLTNTNCYFGVHPSRIRRSQNERARVKDGDIQVINCLYYEIDCADEAAKEKALRDLDKLGIIPACVVDSGGGFHIYVLLRSPYILDTPEKYQHAIDLQYAFVEFAGGEKGVSDLSRVLRVPGTRNLKSKYAPNFPTVQIVRWDMSHQYELSEIEPLLQPYIDARNNAKAHTPYTPSTAVSLSDSELLDILFKSKNGLRYKELWDGFTFGDHSRADQQLCNALAWLTGRDIGAMDRLFRQSGLYREKWERKEYRENTLKNAADSAQTIYTPSQRNEEAIAVAEAMVTLNGSHVIADAVVATPNDMDKYLLAQGPDDEGNAQSVFALYGSNFAYSETHGYMHYNGRFWETKKASAKLERCITATLKRRQSLGLRHGQDALLRAAKPNAGPVKACEYMLKSMITVEVDEFDSDPELLNCKNGVVNLRTGTLTAHSSAQRFTYCVPVDYDPMGDYVEWVELLAKITSRPELVDYLQMAVGYTATGYTSEECLFYVHGPTRSGKGTFVETLLTLLGKPLAVQADFSTFTAKREGDMQNFDLAPLKPARFVAASESNKYDTLNEAKIKSATGGDGIRCAFKHKDHFEYKPQFKIWLISNHPVKGDVDDDAFWGRVKVVEFPNSFLGKEDKSLKQRMKSPTVLKGVLRWMVEGAMAWFASGHGLTPPQAVIDATSARRRDLDYVQQWLDECCKVDSAAWTTNHDLRTSYESWCKAEGTTPKGADQFSKALSQKGFQVGFPKRNALGKTARGVVGLSII